MECQEANRITYLIQLSQKKVASTIQRCSHGFGHEFENDQFLILFSSFQSLSHVQLFATPWITAHQASLSITSSQSLLKLMSIQSVMPSSHLILCHPLLLLPPIPPRIRVFSNESTLHMRWPKYWSFSFSISPNTIRLSQRMYHFSVGLRWPNNHYNNVNAAGTPIRTEHLGGFSFSYQFQDLTNNYLDD